MEADFYSFVVFFIGIWGSTIAVDTNHFVEDVSLYGLRFTTNIVFDYNTNKLRCANTCINQASCKSWTFSGTQCTGYDTIFETISDGNPLSDARYYYSTERHTVFDCFDLKSKGSPSGIFKIYPDNVLNGVNVYCDMDKDGGGWIVIQNRFNGSVDFYRNWNEYKEGFGDLNTEFWLDGCINFYRTLNEYKYRFGDLNTEIWLGNSYIHLITKLDTYLLRFDLEDADGNKGYAVYNKFKINDEDDDFRLTVSDYSGDLGDSMGFTYNNNAVFSTKDKGRSYCASGRQGAWWYKSCTWVNLNGLWIPGTNSWTSMMWNSWKGLDGMKKTSMKLRRK